MKLIATARRSPLSVIVNADDLGASPEVNSATLALMRQNHISSATIMANGPAVDEILDVHRSLKHCSFGIHLNAEDFHPVSKAKLRGLLTPRHTFNRQIRRITPDPILCADLYVEFCAQIERLLYANIRISHIDSHHHIHTIPWLLPILKAVQKKYNLRRVRISRNIYSSQESPSKLWNKKIWNCVLRSAYRTRTTDGFTDLLTFMQVGDGLHEKFRSVEIMVHPGDPRFQDEVDILQKPWRSLFTYPIELIPYFAL